MDPKPSHGATDAPITEEQLDDMVEQSFPASDPPSTTPITRVGRRKPRQRRDGPAPARPRT